jgi:hypothetical protein
MRGLRTIQTIYSVLNMEVDGKRKRGKSKKIWKDCLKEVLIYINSWQEI